MQGTLGFFILYVVITFTEGLWCYHCVYVSDKKNLPANMPFGPPFTTNNSIGFPNYPNCNNPNDVRLGECGADEWMVSALEKDEDTSQINPTVPYACVTLSFDGSLYPIYGGHKLTMTIRSCIRTASFLSYPLYNYEGKMNNLTIPDAEVRYGVYSTGLGPFMDINATDVNVCICDTGKCNSYGGGSGNIKFSLYVMFFSLIVVSFI